MSLSRSPSPHRNGGWASPGLTTPQSGSSRHASPVRGYTNGNARSAINTGSLGNAGNVALATAPNRTLHERSLPSFSPRREGLGSHLRKLGGKLPPFRNVRRFSDKEKLGRGRLSAARSSLPTSREMLAFIGMILWKLRSPIVTLLAIILLVSLLLSSPILQVYRRASFLGGGSKFVIMQAANLGGGVMEWKGPREWAIERDSVKNKRGYARKWGYELEIVDMSTKKRYAHEWRESWEKVDTIRNAMRKYPNAEWFWWLDLHTYIMEPSYSLQEHVFKNLQENTYRNINVYNPLNITHPLTEHFLDPISLSPVGDGLPESINMIIPQDCGGFNLGSFFVRRSVWTDRLLDIWWDPVGYEQKHMEWEHKEQDSLEYLYKNQPWVRPHVAFIPQRKINSFPLGACGDKDAPPNPKIHYRSKDRDFLVNMAGCEWGRDCWAEMFNFRKLSDRLNRNLLQRIRDTVVDNVRAVLHSPPVKAGPEPRKEGEWEEKTDEKKKQDQKEGDKKQEAKQG